MIEKEKYRIGEFDYVNFTCLHGFPSLIEDIRQWRNHPDIRKYMYNDSVISEEEHLLFISSLSGRNDVLYWLVHYREKPIGVLSLVRRDKSNKQAELGYYLIPTILNSGFGLAFVFHNFLFSFKLLKFNLLFGAIHVDNTNALLLDKYMGCIMGKHLTIKNDGGNQDFLTWSLRGRDFLEKSTKANDAKLFIRFCEKEGS